MHSSGDSAIMLPVSCFTALAISVFYLFDQDCLSLNDGRCISILGYLSAHLLSCFVMKHVLGVTPVVFILNACGFVSAAYDSSYALLWL